MPRSKPVTAEARQERRRATLARLGALAAPTTSERALRSRLRAIDADADATSEYASDAEITGLLRGRNSRQEHP
jgi:hypothetical protein